MSLPAEGWNHVRSVPPPSSVLLEWGRFVSGWEWRDIGYDRDFVYINKLQENLYWRWTGIGKEELAARGQPQRPQHWIWYKPANSRTWVERDIYAPEYKQMIADEIHEGFRRGRAERDKNRK